MTSIENRLRRLEQQAANVTRADPYWSALKRTNRTGMATIDDYALTQGPLAGEVRADWCAQAPFDRAVAVTGIAVSGLPTVAAVPPDEQLPEATCAALDHLSRIVHEVPEPPVSPNFRRHRIDCATWYLALGDDRGLSIRGEVWEKVRGGWRYTAYAEKLAKSSGMTEEALEALSQDFPHLIPRWRDPVIQERVKSSSPVEAWIPWWDLANIVKARAAEPWSDPVRSGQRDEPN